MVFTHLAPLPDALFSLLTIATLVLAFVMLGSRWLKDYMYAFAAQSWLIAALSALVAYYGGFTELYGVALLTVVFRGIVLPYMILRILRRLEVQREILEFIRPSSSLVLGALLVVLALAVAVHITRALGLSGSNVIVLALTVMLSMKLIGFLMLIVRHEAISQILGLMVLENGIFLGSQILIPGMPMLIELVILFDLLVAVACFGVLVRYLLNHVGSTSSQHLKRLKG